jgi:hypothetical protein
VQRRAAGQERLDERFVPLAIVDEDRHAEAEVDLEERLGELRCRRTVLALSRRCDAFLVQSGDGLGAAADRQSARDGFSQLVQAPERARLVEERRRSHPGVKDGMKRLAATTRGGRSPTMIARS